MAWASDATNSSVSLESTAAKLGNTDRSSIRTRIQASDWCKRVAYGHINPGVLPIFLIVKFGNLVPIHSLLRYYSQSIVRVHATWKCYTVITFRDAADACVTWGTTHNVLIQSGSCIHLIVLKSSEVRVYISRDLLPTITVFLPVTLLQYISSINHKLKYVQCYMHNIVHRQFIYVFKLNNLQFTTLIT